MTTPRKNGLEWTVFALGLSLVLGVVGILVYAAATRPGTEPRFEIVLGAPETRGGVRVPVTLRNVGDRTVAAAVVEVTGGTRASEVTFGYVPRHAERTGAALLDTLAAPVRARVLGYEDP